MNPVKSLKTERSFTLLETIIALAILTGTILQLVGSQGKIAYFNEYSRRLNEASWLAKRVMSQVEYNWTHYPFKELETSLKDQKFEGLNDSDYTYDLEIKEWKFPILDFITGGGAEKDKDGNTVKQSSAEEAEGDMVRNMLDQVLGDEILKVAYVEVFWPEGAKRNSVSLTYLLTNQRKVDEELLKLEPVAAEIEKAQQKENNPNAGGDPKTEADCRAAGRVWDGAKCLLGTPVNPQIPGTNPNPMNPGNPTSPNNPANPSRGNTGGGSF